MTKFKFKAYISLLRLHAPTGYALLFYPCMFGLGISINSYNQLMYIPLFLSGALIMRSSGCIINDIFDRNIDALVDRTKNRPLASKAINIQEALFLLSILLSCGLVILISLPLLAIKIGLLTMPLIIIYPLMKRITYFPQLVLGMSFGGAGILISYATITNSLSLQAFILYIGCVFWTLGYDCIYAFMDMKDDKKIGVKSIAIFLHKYNYKFWIMSFYLIFILSIIFNIYQSSFNIFNVLIVLLSAVMLIWQVQTLDINNRNNCLVRFNSNSYVGFIISLGLIINKLAT